jgi:hypothetical protein
MKRTPLRPGKPLARRKRIRAMNPKWRRAETERAYGTRAYRAWGASQPCCVCGKEATEDAPNHNAHIKPRGELPSGMGRKPDKRWLVTMCHTCHSEYHQRGEDTFQRLWKIDLDLEAAARWARWSER